MVAMAATALGGTALRVVLRGVLLLPMWAARPSCVELALFSGSQVDLHPRKPPGYLQWRRCYWRWPPVLLLRTQQRANDNAWLARANQYLVCWLARRTGRAGVAVRVVVARISDVVILAGDDMWFCNVTVRRWPAVCAPGWG